MSRYILLLLLAMPALGGCSGVMVVELAVRALSTPQPEVRADAREAARRHFDEGRFGEAAWQYKSALSKNRNSVEVLNGLAASYDRLGRYDLSERYYHEALAIDPRSAQTLNNLGYSYYLQGKPDLALAYLSHVPGHPADMPVIEGNRTLAEAALDNAVSPVKAAAPAPVKVAALSDRPQPAPAAGGKARPKIEIANGAERDAMKAVDAAPVTVATLKERPQPAPAAIGKTKPKIEIANGAGRNGMAARFAKYLGGKGVSVARLANARPFDKEITTIYYRPGARAAAEDVAALLPAPARLAEVTHQRAPVRIELGRDLIAFDIKLAADDSAAPVKQASDYIPDRHAANGAAKPELEIADSAERKSMASRFAQVRSHDAETAAVSRRGGARPITTEITALPTAPTRLAVANNHAPARMQRIRDPVTFDDHNAISTGGTVR
jgi:LytR cell envelope-related transcriptional attenuator/Tetratricopeptide repeat